MSFPQLERKTIKTYLTETEVCKLSVIAYQDGIMEVQGQVEDIFAVGNVEYWTSMENPIKPTQLPVFNTFPDMPDLDHIPLQSPEPYFNMNMNKGSTNILNGQFKFNVKYTLQGDKFTLPSDPIYIHMVLRVDGKEPVNMDVKMDMTSPMRLIDEKKPEFNPFASKPETNNQKSTFYDGYGDYEHEQRRKVFAEQNRPNYGDRSLDLIDLPKNQEYFGLPKKNANDVMNAIGPDVNFRKTRDTDLFPCDPYGR